MVSQDIKELPPISYVRSGRAKYQRITVRRDRTVTVTVPRGGNLNEAQKFLQSKLSWVKKQLQKIEQYEEQKEDVDSDIDLDKAQEELFERLEYFSKKHDLDYNRAAFRCQKTKWGSCSGRNNISLNVNICFLPKEIQDYLLLHELCHTKVKNHSKKFWRQLDEYCSGQARALDKKLKKYRMKLRAAK